jgi:hypothetical protein
LAFGGRSLGAGAGAGAGVQVGVSVGMDRGPEQRGTGTAAARGRIDEGGVARDSKIGEKKRFAAKEGEKEAWC